MAKLSSKEASRTARVLLYGAPKSGKSQLAGDLSKHFKLIWVDMENGHEVLFKLPASQQDNIELINLPDTRSFPIAIETCLKIVKVPVSICDLHGKVGCVRCKKDAPEDFVDVDFNSLGPDTIIVFDSITQLTNSATANITKKESDDYKLQTDDWGHLGKLLDIFFSHIQQAKCNVVCISHETEVDLESKRKQLVPVAGTRNFSRTVAKYFGHVVYAERKNMKHVFASSTQYATNILTGSRTDVTLEDSEDPSLLRIFKPELFANEVSVAPATSATKPVVAGSNTASSLLQRMKQKGH